MPPTVNFGQVKDNQEFEPLPIAKYPCVLAVTNIQTDSNGEVVKDIDDQPAIMHTKGNDEKWEIKATILDGKHTGRWIRDNLSFGEKAVKRVKILFQRAGLIEGDETYDCEPAELDGTYWWVDIDRHEPRKERDGKPKMRKDGKPITDARVGFAGYAPMTPQEAKRYRESYQAWEVKKAAGNAGDAELDAAFKGEADGDEVPF
jgi:hypothetical protein